MLIEFRVENHRSLRQEQVLSLVAASLGKTDPRPRIVQGYSKPVLPVAALYGANASGKTNVLTAIGYMRDAVLYSHRLLGPGDGFPRTPFAWGGKESAPSLFEVTAIAQGMRFEYGFVVDDQVVLEEWLYAWPKGSKQKWFERDAQKIKTGDWLRPARSKREVARLDFLIESTRPNALFLSTASQHQLRSIEPVYAWFSKIATVNPATTFLPREFSQFQLVHRLQDDADLLQRPMHRTAISDPKYKQLLLRFLQSADLGICDVRHRLADNDARSWHFGYDLELKHRQNDEDSWLEFTEESRGTQMFIELTDQLFRILEHGDVLIVDELEASLHPSLGATIIGLFNNLETNPRNAQLIFTTHDTNLLGTTLGEPALRRDQIWFTEKDSEGATTLYPLTDFKPRNVENLERGYLQGRYGAIPFLGNLPPTIEGTYEATESK